MSDMFDFGFTAVDEDELDVVQQRTAMALSTDDRLNRLYGAIIPLLNNLKSNPEKDYILWPNRLAKVDEFETLLKNIYEGN
jgi:hypothetical protein|tara:strand:+ start:203 stop:445 length:243 start_codon:yes stop_codon:yes gene_type:complete